MRAKGELQEIRKLRPRCTRSRRPRAEFPERPLCQLRKLVWQLPEFSRKFVVLGGQE